MEISSRITHFQAKLDAEWGPYDLENSRKSKNVTILDVRDRDGYHSEHIPGAINIPLVEIEKRMTEIPKDKTVVTYCWNITCHAAPKAALILAKAGYDVKELVGGIEEWKKLDISVEK